jgi:hypothetical protein
MEALARFGKQSGGSTTQPVQIKRGKTWDRAMENLPLHPVTAY